MHSFTVYTGWCVVATLLLGASAKPANVVPSSQSSALEKLTQSSSTPAAGFQTVTLSGISAQTTLTTDNHTITIPLPSSQATKAFTLTQPDGALIANGSIVIVPVKATKTTISSTSSSFVTSSLKVSQSSSSKSSSSFKSSKASTSSGSITSSSVLPASIYTETKVVSGTTALIPVIGGVGFATPITLSASGTASSIASTGTAAHSAVLAIVGLNNNIQPLLQNYKNKQDDDTSGPLIVAFKGTISSIGGLLSKIPKPSGGGGGGCSGLFGFLSCAASTAETAVTGVTNNLPLEVISKASSDLTDLVNEAQKEMEKEEQKTTESTQSSRSDEIKTATQVVEKFWTISTSGSLKEQSTASTTVVSGSTVTPFTSSTTLSCSGTEAATDITYWVSVATNSQGSVVTSSTISETSVLSTGCFAKPTTVTSTITAGVPMETTYLVYPVDGASRTQLDSIADTLNEALGLDNSDEIILDDTTSVFVGVMDSEMANNLTSLNAAIDSVEVDANGADISSDDASTTPNCDPGNHSKLRKREDWPQYPAAPEIRFVSQPKDPFIANWNTQDFIYDTIDGKGITVYVLDSGLNLASPEIAISAAQVDGGYRWLWPPPKKQRFWRKHSPQPQTESDSTGHGSCVTSKVSGFLYGIAKLSSIVIGKIQHIPGTTGGFAASSILENLSFVAQDVKDKKLQGKAVLNLSFGGGGDAKYVKSLYKVIADIIANDVVVVVASGNSRGRPGGSDNVNTYPQLFAGDVSLPKSTKVLAALSNMIVVGSVNVDGARTKFSQGGPLMDISAPGSLDDIYGVQCAAGSGSAPDPVRKEGTSFAAPTVAGLCAYYMSLYPALTGTGAASRVKAFIKKTSWSRNGGPVALWNQKESHRIGWRPSYKKRSGANEIRAVADAACPNGKLPAPAYSVDEGKPPALNSNSPAGSSKSSTTGIKSSPSQSALPCWNYADPYHSISASCTCSNGASTAIAASTGKNTGSAYQPCPYPTVPAIPTTSKASSSNINPFPFTKTLSGGVHYEVIACASSSVGNVAGYTITECAGASTTTLTYSSPTPAATATATILVSEVLGYWTSPNLLVNATISVLDAKQKLAGSTGGKASVPWTFPVKDLSSSFPVGEVDVAFNTTSGKSIDKTNYKEPAVSFRAGSLTWDTSFTDTSKKAWVKTGPWSGKSDSNVIDSRELTAYWILESQSTSSTKPATTSSSAPATTISAASKNCPPILLTDSCENCVSNRKCSSCAKTDFTCLTNQCLSDHDCKACGTDCSKVGGS